MPNAASSSLRYSRLPLTAASDSANPRSPDQAPQPRKLWAALLCVTTLGLVVAGCEEEGTQRVLPARDAAIDSGRDARVAQPDDNDAGKLVESAQCGLLDHVLVAVFRGDERIFPGKVNTKESVASDATVMSIDRGSLEEWKFVPSDRGAYGRIRLRTLQATFTILAHGVASFGLTVGQAATLSLEHSFDGLYPPRTRLRVEAGGELAFFHTVAGDAPMGFSHEPGATQCGGSQPCGGKRGYTWISKALRVRGPCGDSVELSAGGRGVVCGYEVFAGELRSDVEYLTCVGHGLPGPEFVLSRELPADDSDHDAGR